MYKKLHNYIHKGEPLSTMKEGPKQFLLNPKVSKTGIKADTPKIEQDLKESSVEYLYDLAKERKIKNLNKKHIHDKNYLLQKLGVF